MSNGHEKCRKGLLERLRDGIVIGDGGFVIALEKRGYVMAGPWTPEAVIENPDAVEQLHKEFLRAGSDVMQAFTFYGSDDKIKISENCRKGKKITCVDLINNGCKIAKKVSDPGNALMAGSISQNPAYTQGKGKDYVKSEVFKQAKLFKENEADFIICEFFQNIEEMEWTIEECVKTGLPVVSCMSIGVLGDLKGVTPGECAVRMVKAGADVVGVNCIFDPWSALKTIKLMKVALDEEGLHPYLITQPNGFYTTGTGREGYAECPEYPFAMETRTITRMDAHKYAREAYELGVRYIGGCCGFEAYHIRAIAEELAPERGFFPEASEKHEPWGASLRFNAFELVRKRANREYWENLVPHSGRPTAPTYDLPNP